MREYAAAVVAVLLFCCSLQAVAQRTRPAQESYAVVAGTVFQENGRTLAGAAVTLKEDPEDGATSRRKPQIATSDGRGEFAFRVPTIPMRYTAIVEALGYVAQDKEVSVAGEQRADVYFQMERAASNKK